MENRRFMIDKIPAVLYGGNSENCFLYIHGKLGFKEEAEMFARIAVQSFDGSEFEKCLFVSPVLDMEKLIQNMMQWAGVSEQRLEAESLIPTDFGETLSWKYYEYAKAHPITKWQCPTYILYGEQDNMTAQDTAGGFAEKFHSSLTVMKNGEHWFHTPEQLDVLNQWVKECI